MDKLINDFSFRVATVNGTGSQSSNNILYKTLFRMGVGVCGKNMFPSNIQGLPTWFQIRVSPKGYQNLREHDDIAVLMNKDTGAQDIGEMRAGSTILYNSDIIKFTPEQIKPGMIMYALPVEELSKKITNAKLRTLLKNLFYVGVMKHLYDLDEEVLKGVIRDMFKSKQSAIDANMEALQIGIDYAKANFEKKDRFTFAKADLNDNKIFIEGNAAGALGSVYAGCTVVAWYPITPSSSLAESMEGYLKKTRVRKDGKLNYAIVQAEDELAAIGMVIGAGWAGARAMTSTSGPGISLMQEFLSLAYYAEVPAVIWNIQRVGPSTGLPTRTQQGDYRMCAGSGHGDTKHILVIPSTPKECFEMANDAFNLSERFQTPVFVMSDLDLGMNNWIDDDFEYKKPQYDRGKVLQAKDDKLNGWGRYNDVDGDGIPYRTLPGNPDIRAGYFTRGSGHDEFARYTERPEAYTRNVDRLLRKWHTAKKHVPKPVMHGSPGAKIGIIAYGTSDSAVIEAMDRIQNKNVKYMRLRAYPFSSEVEEFIKGCDKVIVVEQNRDKQMRALLEWDLPGYNSKMRSLTYYGGFPLSSDLVERELKKELGA